MWTTGERTEEHEAVVLDDGHLAEGLLVRHELLALEDVEADDLELVLDAELLAHHGDAAHARRLAHSVDGDRHGGSCGVGWGALLPGLALFIQVRGSDWPRLEIDSGSS